MFTKRVVSHLFAVLFILMFTLAQAMPASAAGPWTSTGSLITARYLHTATLLANGKVLVVGGGYNGSSTLASAELFDPSAGTWTSTGSLAAARYQHTATLLPNGKVLVVGGANFNGISNIPLASAELYDPVAGTWTATGSLATARYSHTATLLANSKVLVVGGYGASGALASAELYDPSAGTWSSTGSLAGARYDHTATLLANGQVLVVGGTLDGLLFPLASAELYDPVAGTWTSTGSLAGSRWYHTATLLANGKVLAVGGTTGSSSFLASAELYDPVAGTWTSTGSLATSRTYHTATLLANGQALVVGGYSSSILASTELYDPGTGTWTSAGSLTAARVFHTATLLDNGHALVTGGLGSSYLASAELYTLPDIAAPTIPSFSATSPSSSLVIPITAFTASDNVGVTGYMITEMPTAPLAGDSGWSVAPPSTHTVGADGRYTLYPWARDAIGNVSALFGSPVSVTVDTTAPTVSMSSSAANPTNASPIAVTVTFSENVTGFTSGDIITTNATVGNFAGSGASYSFDLTPSANGPVTADIAAGVAQDAAGNDNTAATQFSRTSDTTAPGVSMSSSATNPTNASPIAVTVTFSESITGFTSGDIIASNATVGNFAGSGASYSFDLFPSADGPVTADIAAGLAQDAAGNDNTAAPQFSRAYDGTAPTVSLSSSATDPTHASPIPVTVTFSESVVGFTSGDITASNATVGNFAGSGASYSFDLTPSTDGPVTADIAAGVAQDSSGNNNTAAPQFSRAYDGTAPTVSMSSSTTDPTHASPIAVTVTFSESVVGFTSADITATNATVGSFAGSGAGYSFDLTPSANGPITADIAADVAQDAAGNNNTAAIQFSRAYDGTAPVITSIIRANPNPTNLASVDFTVTFSKPVSGVDTGDFNLAATGVTGASVSSVSGSAATYTVVVNTGSGNGTLRLDLVDDDTILDAASNPLGGTGIGNGSFTIGEVYTVDKSVTLTFTSSAAQDGWILESSETSSKGGTINVGANTFLLGDDVANKQYRAILSFSTGAVLPDNAVITSVTLKVKKQAVLGGGNPLTIFQGFVVDVKNGLFGTAALQASDFQAKASAKPYGPFKPALVGGWYNLDLTGASGNINKLGTLTTGLTQIRLRFKLDDNHNALANTLSLFSGNAPAASRPQLIITYYVP